MIKDTLDNNEQGKLNDKKIRILKENFPNCFSGGTFDIEKFKKEINQDIYFSSEGYELNFLGKNYAKYIADSIDTETVLVPNVDHNNKNNNIKSENIYITGDNLEVLKHLRKSYTDKIKVIYIDPPYNTGGDGFVYNDSFNFAKDELKKMLDTEDDEAERILNMTSSNSSSHSAWLTFMYPRLFLGRELLKDDGLIFISIDDNEEAQLKLLCDDIFGESNFLACITRPTGTPTGGGNEIIVNKQDYIMVYAKNIEMATISGIPMTDEESKNYNLEDDNGRYLIRTLRRTGGEDRREDRPSMFYPVTAPDGTEVLPYGPGGYESRWRCGKDTFIQLEKNNRIEWKLVENEEKCEWKVFQKFYLDEGNKQPSNLWDDIEGNKKATREVKDLFDGTKVFDHPKPLDLINRILYLATNEKDDIILDFFSGSATTGHAVMKQNAEDGGNRKYILVQLEEPVNEGSDAKKAGYKTIDQIGRERLIRAAKQIKGKTGSDIDYGFKHYRTKVLNESIIDQIKEFNPNLLASELEVEFDKSTILTTWMNQDGHGLTPPVEEINLGGYIGYYVNDYLYLLDKGLSQQHIDTLLSKIVEDKNFNPTSIVVYGYNLTDFNILTQLETNLKQLRNEEKNIEVSLIKRY
ncbi:site-specific DNA-methyltransferase [Oceanobacillus profundus]|uniref:site-specific DNA-methyltransferase n=1 Tax=Oceanobacillus profundus TaxID=372463 RepID=UPI0036386E51